MIISEVICTGLLDQVISVAVIGYGYPLFFDRYFLRGDMARVVGIGGIFFKAQNPEKLCAWYREHLGFNLEAWGGVIFQSNGANEKTVWSLIPHDSSHFAPSTQPFMINYRVDDLQALLSQLRSEGCAVEDKMEESEFGKFGWVMDPEGNRVELWEPLRA